MSFEEYFNKHVKAFWMGLLATGLLAIFLVILIFGGMMKSERAVARKCYVYGYPTYIYEHGDDGVIYCQRRVNGTDEIVPLSQLED